MNSFMRLIIPRIDVISIHAKAWHIQKYVQLERQSVALWLRAIGQEDHLEICGCLLWLWNGGVNGVYVTMQWDRQLTCIRMMIRWEEEGGEGGKRWRRGKKRRRWGGGEEEERDPIVSYKQLNNPHPPLPPLHSLSSISNLSLQARSCVAKVFSAAYLDRQPDITTTSPTDERWEGVMRAFWCNCTQMSSPITTNNPSPVHHTTLIRD